jgi:hypothetical protein
MQTWFSCKVKYQRIDEHGKQSRANETYLVEAINFTEAETRIFEMMEQYGHGDIIVAGITKTNFSEIINYDDGQYWYKAKVQWEDVSDDSGKVSKITNYLLVAANSVKQTYERVEEAMENMMVPIEIPAISLSPVLDVFPLFTEEEENTQIPDHLTPISDFDKEAKNNVVDHSSDLNENLDGDMEDTDMETSDNNDLEDDMDTKKEEADE